MSLCHKLLFSNPYTLQPNSLDLFIIFQIMNSTISNNLSRKNEWFRRSGYKDKGIRTFEFMAKTQFLFGFYAF